MAPVALLLAAAFACAPALAEDGYDLWLRYPALEGPAADALGPILPHPDFDSPTYDINQELDGTLLAAQAELDYAFHFLRRNRNPGRAVEGSVRLDCPRIPKGDGGFSIRTGRNDADGVSHPRDIVISGPGSLSCLYGAYALLRELNLGADPTTLNIASAPAMSLRMVDHWDNPDGHVERGYAGRSIFDWWRLPEHLDQRMIDYARANASLGINAVAVNNVNARAMMLEPRYIAKLTRLADAWRPYGIRVFLSARFSAPRDIGGLATADPLDPAVRAWWKAKANEIYASIPDFGGFLVKANSEGQPGPQDYGRTHADGANMLAEALGDRGTVIWRAFVYSAEDQTDRAKQAYNEFVPLDGQFVDNVIIQIKNGAIDFQPREPFHPMFGAMPKTRLMLEVQVTKEYLGFSTHQAFLAPMWKEVLDAETGHGGTVADSVRSGGIAAVANIGSDRNWSGSHFGQADWYAAGRLAWDPTLSSEQIAREWAAQTFSREPQFLEAVVPMMLTSRQAVVDYMTPMGLAHLMDTGHHYGPGPWVCDLARPEWNPCYYHRADKDGIGFDRTADGSNALGQYAPSVARQWADPKAMDEDYLLWFHHLPWEFRTKSGRALWPELVHRYDRGLSTVDAMAATWAAQEAHVDPERFADVASFLEIQRREARWWRDASIAYWQSLNHLPLPNGAEAPEFPLEYYRSLTFPEAPGN